MMSKPAYLSVEIVTDKPTSGKISIPLVVSVAEQTGLSITWSQTQYFRINVIFRGVCYLQTFIQTSFKNIFLVSDRFRVHVYEGRFLCS